VAGNRSKNVITVKNATPAGRLRKTVAMKTSPTPATIVRFGEMTAPAPRAHARPTRRSAPRPRLRPSSASRS
jgi:hypothetical protein